MAIQIGATIPDVELKVMGKERPESIQTGELFQAKRVVLFALPGAFTPTCSKSHLPGYIELSDQIRDKGVAQIICLSVNDVWVMAAWGAGFGVRSLRYSIVVNDGVITNLNVEEPRKFEVSDAKSMLALL